MGKYGNHLIELGLIKVWAIRANTAGASTESMLSILSWVENTLLAIETSGDGPIIDGPL